MRPTTILTCCLLFTLACGGSGDATPATSTVSANAPAPTQSARLFDEGLRRQPCTLLTAEMVAAVAGVPAGQIEQRALSTMCLYEWEGGNASIGFIEAYESADEARSSFENEHQNMSGAEVKAAMEQIAEGTKDKLEEDARAGEQVPAAEAVDTVTNAMSDSMGGGITFEAVSGVGDMAAYDITRHETAVAGKTLVSYANKLDTVLGNLSFDLTFILDGDPTDGKMYKAEVIALARAVIEGLQK